MNSDVDRRTRVLIVDDVPIIADTLAQILSQSGFDTAVAYSGEAALQSAFEVTPDVVISDVLMGKLSGIDLAKVFRASIPACRVILFSGQIATEGLLQDARAQGYDFEALPKPISPLVFLEMLEDKPR